MCTVASDLSCPSASETIIFFPMPQSEHNIGRFHLDPFKGAMLYGQRGSILLSQCILCALMRPDVVE